MRLAQWHLHTDSEIPLTYIEGDTLAQIHSKRHQHRPERWSPPVHTVDSCRCTLPMTLGLSHCNRLSLQQSARCQRIARYIFHPLLHLPPDQDHQQDSLQIREMRVHTYHKHWSISTHEIQAPYEYKYP